MRSTLVLSVLVVMIAGCASAPDLTTYTVDMTPSASVRTGIDFAVERFTVSERLDQSRIVIRTTPIRVERYRSARWAEGLGGMVQRKLAAELGPRRGGKRPLVASGKVLAFEQVDSPSGARALARLEVTLRDGELPRYESPLLERTYESDRPVDGAGVEPLVQALSRALEDIAAQIANDAASL
jgi:uncharacterized lipoprotein YmbA